MESKINKEEILEQLALILQIKINKNKIKSTIILKIISKIIKITRKISKEMKACLIIKDCRQNESTLINKIHF